MNFENHLRIGQGLARRTRSGLITPFNAGVCGIYCQHICRVGKLVIYFTNLSKDEHGVASAFQFVTYGEKKLKGGID